MNLMQAWNGVIIEVDKEKENFTALVRHGDDERIMIQLVFTFRELTYKSDIDNVKPGARLTWLINNEREVLELQADKAHMRKYWLPKLKSKIFDPAN